jgi:hypothetical protein
VGRLELAAAARDIERAFENNRDYQFAWIEPRPVENLNNFQLCLRAKLSKNDKKIIEHISTKRGLVLKEDNGSFVFYEQPKNSR